jgi:hypothetical protein
VRDAVATSFVINPTSLTVMPAEPEDFIIFLLDGATTERVVNRDGNEAGSMRVEQKPAHHKTRDLEINPYPQILMGTKLNPHPPRTHNPTGTIEFDHVKQKNLN